MFTLSDTATCELVEKKSRFIAVAAPVADEAAAQAFVIAVTDRAANHNCWAWRVGQAYRFSDDGEPSGTAGKPILTAIDGQSLDRVAVVVTRFFGGILLGTGGLIRAYGGAAAECLRSAAKEPIIARSRLVARIGFSDLALVRARLSAIDRIIIAGETYLPDGLGLSLDVPDDSLEAVRSLLTDLTSGRISLSQP